MSPCLNPMMQLVIFHMYTNFEGSGSNSSSENWHKIILERQMDE